MEDIVLTAKSTVCLNNNIAIRFEHNYCNGTIILINTETDDIWLGNKQSLIFINEIKNFNNPKTLEEVYSKIICSFPEYHPEEVIDSLNTIINDLYEKKFITVKQ